LVIVFVTWLAYAGWRAIRYRGTFKETIVNSSETLPETVETETAPESVVANEKPAEQEIDLLPA
jgi:hypothetical protein